MMWVEDLGNKLLETLSQHPNAVGISLILTFLFGVIGLISLILYVRDRKLKKASYSIRSWKILDQRRPDIGGITLQYDNESVENLCKTTVAVWNSGTDTIEKTDVADPFRIRVKNGLRVLTLNILVAGSPSNGIQVDRQGQDISIAFEFLDRFEGLAIQFFHTGISSDDIEVSGRIKGARLKRKDVERLAIWMKGIVYFGLMNIVILLVPRVSLVPSHGNIWDWVLNWAWALAWIAAYVFGSAAIHRAILLRVAPKELLDIVSTPPRLLLSRRLDERDVLLRADD
jgi:hypothetical protein